MTNRATLKNIAEKLQISISTVSRALKDHPDIAKETKRKVQELAEVMDYEPNAITNSVVEAYIISFECEANRMIDKYSTFNINELIEFF